SEEDISREDEYSEDEDDESRYWEDSEDEDWDESDEDDESMVPEPVPSIPFASEQEIPEYVMPAETFPDKLEKEASEIIDRAICRAIAVVSVYKDDRHSNVSYAFDYDANGFVKELNDDQESLYRAFIAYADEFKDFELLQSDYNGDLLSDVLTISKPLSLTRPDIDSYFGFKPGGNLSTVYSSYFDPYKDANYTVKDGDIDKESVRHAAKLLQRIIKRVVAKMPEGLSTYDKYLYLATVVAEQNHYDSTPDNCFTPFGALVCGKSVCEGYTRAFLLLCREADLWCAYRFGMPKGGGHIWNMIKLDTGIYNVDITWSDNYETGSKKWFRYFIKSDSDFVSDGHNANDGVKGTGSFEPNPFEKSK
ncbi:MAG: hypothetical protein J5760_00985, partial [Clostridia bacterium]|nr:hypothetical protein [Clostridia bacterium]